ncbi:hypothetical protein THAOC_15043 [Thalassiosira oceanica]|uniref:Uncharacterized protein n=1 Tax=Thalassiosira oceanica TaxID=159749 RepID=K0SDU8_THAOC|nr:hypothetical protein THAOC_15043 [Thalassiosira oceanica]|eukprot:EJK64243.1 hypothetical protein THAOC_15043 [Thalassiosira oceanica]
MKLTAIAFACYLASARSTPFVAQLDSFSDGQHLPYDDATPDAGPNAENPKHRGQAWVPTSVASYIQTAALSLGAGRGDTSSIELGIFDSSETSRQATETNSVLPLTTVTGTTDEHVDHLKAGCGPTVPTDDVVAFVFLNTNPDAHFELDGDCVPVVKNSLVAFNGGKVQAPHCRERGKRFGSSARSTQRAWNRLVTVVNRVTRAPVPHPPPLPRRVASQTSRPSRRRFESSMCGVLELGVLRKEELKNFGSSRVSRTRTDEKTIESSSAACLVVCAVEQ